MKKLMLGAMLIQRNCSVTRKGPVKKLPKKGRLINFKEGYDDFRWKQYL